MAEPQGVPWEGVLAHLQSNHHGIYRQWFGDLEPLGVHDGSLTIRASSSVHRDYLRRQCLQPFNDAVQSATGALTPVRFLGPEDPEPSFGRDEAERVRGGQGSRADTNNHDRPAPSRPGDVASDSSVHEGKPITETGGNSSGGMVPDLAGRHASPQRRPTLHVASEAELASHPDALHVNPDYEFSNFVTGPNNRLAHAAAVAVSENPGRAYNPLFIHGDVGLGKTHLLQAICLKIMHDNPRAVLHYISCDAFINDFMNSVQGGHMSAFRHRFRNVDLIVVDDIHFLSKRDRTQEEFFHTFNSLYQANKQIILSSDAPPEEIPDLEERLVSRFKWGLVAKVDRPGYETRVAILQSKAKLRGIEMPDDVAGFIAGRIDTNIRELEGAIIKLQIHATVEDRGIDMDLARKALGDMAEVVTRGPSIEAIMTVVAEFFSVKKTEILGKRRHKSISQPRQICMFLARKMTRHSLEEIGAYFGGRDHTTVMHAVKTITARCDEDPETRALVDRLERSVLDLVASEA